ncbi:MAG: hypothetical protein ERJ67_08170 [Aphanocapsa feldmannii 277cV]|uniref:Uncharacterized protein n=1 Tax=Aphanocapsa feldmannii 277cV TaxID=2507553 RepID=A0A524RM66_9CHRO|nr:MAG: hypothetical protein ERJ67_08170 [Aphanocapsa feldmannii 277cV]
MNSSDSALPSFDTAAGDRPLLPRQCQRHDSRQLSFSHPRSTAVNSSDSALAPFSAPPPFAAQGRHSHSHSGQRILRQWNPTVVNTVQEQG